MGSSEFFAPPKWTNSTDSDKRKLISWKSKLTEELLPRKSSGLKANLSKKSPSVRFSTRTRWLIPLPSPEVREPLVLSRDSVLTDFQERPIEVSERLPVSVLGIHLPLSGLLLELVIKVTSIEPKSTKRSTELELVQLEVLLTTPPLIKIQTIRTSPQLVDSLTTVLSMKISSCLEVLLWDQERELSPLEKLCFHKPLPSPHSSLRSSSSIPPPRSVTVNSKPSKRSISSQDLLSPSHCPKKFSRKSEFEITICATIILFFPAYEF